MAKTKKSQMVKQEQPRVLQLFLNTIGSVHTKKGYLYQLDRFLKWNKIEAGNYDDLLKADEKSIQRNLEDYLIHLKDQQLSPDYIPGATSDRIDRSDDVELQTKLKLEEIRAFERMYNEYYESNPYGKQFPFTEPEIPEGFGGIMPQSDSQEQMMVIVLMVGIIAASVVIGFYSMRNK